MRSCTQTLDWRRLVSEARRLSHEVWTMNRVWWWTCQTRRRHLIWILILPKSTDNIRPPILSVASRITKFVSPAFVRVFAAETPAIPAPTITIFGDSVMFLEPLHEKSAIFVSVIINKAAGYAILSVSCSRTMIIQPPLFSPIIRTPLAAGSARMSQRLRTSQTDCEWMNGAVPPADEAAIMIYKGAWTLSGGITSAYVIMPPRGFLRHSSWSSALASDYSQVKIRYSWQINVRAIISR